MKDFQKLYEENKDFIFRFLLKLCRNDDLAEELTQEAFFRAYMNFSSLREEKAAKVWLCQIAKNCFFAACKEQQNKIFIEESETKNVFLSESTPETSYLEKELSSELAFAISSLEEPFKEVFLLHVLGGASMKSISEIYGKSESWARVIFYRARQKLCALLNN